jgi:two-component system, NtrC family, sensor histidine kinase HydH
MSQPVHGESDRQRLLSQYAEIAALAGALAHEIRNPLSTISLNLELMTEDLTTEENPRDQRLLRKVRIVQRECDRLTQLLEDFMRFARAGEPELALVDLNVEVSEFIEFFRPEAQAARLELSPHLSTDLPAVRVDRDLFRQVLLNLARNAREAMPAGGSLEFLSRRSEDWVELALIDNGPGMSKETRAKVCEVFFSTKPNGSGLGLPTVRKIIERHGGTLQIDSEPGRGTRITLRLPVVGEGGG